MKCLNILNKKQLCRRLRVLFCLIMAAAVIAVSAVQAPSAVAAAQSLSIDVGAAILVDSRTGTVLYEQNADLSVAPASTTKIMTALLVVEAIERGEISADDSVELTNDILHDVPSDASRLGKAVQIGERVPVRDLIYMSLMESDCVACDMLAVHVAGSTEAFVNLMNLRAKQLGCSGVNFVNSHGYPTEGHTATARSLYLITAEAVRHPIFTEAFGCLKYQMPATNITDSRALCNTNRLMYDPERITSKYTSYFNEYVTGGKTGYSVASGNCLVATAEKDGMSLISVVTGVEIKYPDTQTVIDAFTESDRLLTWGFGNYKCHAVVTAGQILEQIAVENGTLESVNVLCADTLYATLEDGVPVESVQVVTKLNGETVKAPVSVGEVVGTVSLMINGRAFASTNLLAAEECVEAPDAPEPNVPLIIILSIIVAAGAGYLIYYTNSKKVLLEDLVGELLGTAKKTESKRPAPDRNSRKPSRDEEETPKDPARAFDEFFSKHKD